MDNDLSSDRPRERCVDFRGLPGERRDGLSAPTRIKIAALLVNQGLDKLGVPLEDAVERVVQSLTPDERRTTEESGAIPPQVQARMSAEVAAMQPLYTLKNSLGYKGALRDRPSQGTSASPIIAVIRPRERVERQRRIGLHHAGHLWFYFARTGLSYGMFNALRAQGFDAAQITAAVNTNNSLGLGANDNPYATARLQRDVPEAMTVLHETRENWKHFYELEKAQAEAIKHGDTNAAAKLGAQMEQARKQADEHDKREQDKVQSKKPERLDDLITQQENIRRRTEEHISQLAPGDDTEAKKLATALDQARRNNDPQSLGKTLDTYAATNVDDRQRGPQSLVCERSWKTTRS
jgi:hypothetical protein